MKRLLAAVVLALPAAPVFAEPVEFQLEPGKLHEHCVQLAKGEQRKYHWKADQAVDFNIHFHVGDKVEYPVKRDAMRGDGGTFKAAVDQHYCWMWTAKKLPAKVTGAVD